MTTESSQASSVAIRSKPGDVLSFAGNFDPSQSHTVLRMENGETIQLETSILEQARSVQTQNYPSDEPLRGHLSPVVIPLIDEKLEVGKRTVATGTVRLRKSTQAYTQALDEVLAVRKFDVERLVLNQPVDVAPPVRQEGNVTVYSLVEEELVLTKQLVLKEEVRIVQRDTERRDTQVVTLHKDHLTIERENHT